MNLETSETSETSEVIETSEVRYFKKYNTNYVPFETPRVYKYDEWCEIYDTYLVEMYEIMIVELKSVFSNEMNHDFDLFCKFVFNNSSRYIM